MVIDMFDTIEMTDELRRRIAFEERNYEIIRLFNGEKYAPCRVVSCKSVVQVTTINPAYMGGSVMMFMEPEVFSDIPKRTVNDTERENLMRWEMSKDPKNIYNMNLREY